MSEERELPKGWAITKLEDIALRITKGGTPTTYGFSFHKSGINFIKVENIKDGRVNLSSLTDYISYDAHTFQAKSQLSINDVLFSIAGTIGETCVVKSEYLPANTNQALAIIKGTDWAIVPNLLNLQLETFVAKVKTKARGGAMNNVSLEDLKKLSIYLPPLPEQQRIVAKIEEFFSSLNKGIESLKTAQEQLKTYRQAVLKWAFEGRFTNKDVKEGKLPVGWTWVKLGEVSNSCLGKMLDQAKNKGIPQLYLRNINVRWGYFELSSLEKMKIEKSEHERYSLKKGDLIICEGGEPGRCAIWNSNDVMYLQKALHRVRMHKGFDVRYVYYFIRFLADSGQLEKLFTGSTIKHLTGVGLKKITFSIPPTLSEQQAIVAEIESRLSVCDKLEESIQTGLQQAEALRQSILKKAFEGKLVPQDPKDEPASVLLERIRTERAKNRPARKAGRTRNGK